MSLLMCVVERFDTRRVAGGACDDTRVRPLATPLANERDT